VCGKVQHRPWRRDGTRPPASWRFTAPQAVARPGALGFRIRARWHAGFGGHRYPGLRSKWLAGGSTGALRARGILGLLVQVEPLLQDGATLGMPGWHAPLLCVPGREAIFLRTWRPVSRARAGAQPHAPTVSATSRRGQCAWPSGAGVHATASPCAAGCPGSFRRAPGRGASSSAPRCVRTNRWRVRATGAVPTATAAALASALSPSAALSRRRARVSVRAPGLPPRSRCAQVARSSVRKSTPYFFLGMSGDSSYGWYPDCTGGPRSDQIHTDGGLG
jgi:hypothetical protein